MSLHRRIAWGIGALLLVAGVAAFIALREAAPKQAADITVVARSVTDGIRTCQAEQKALPCYRALADQLLGEFALQDIFAAVEAAERDPDVLEGCHSLMHFTGQATYLATRNVSQSLGDGNPVCFAGYYHGVLEEYLTEKRADAEDPTTRTEIPQLCEPVRGQSQKKYNECLHGLGHALMFLTETDLPESLRLCDLLATADEQNWCYSGVFMENSTSATNRDHPSPYLKPEDPLYPCTILDDRYLTMCYTLQSFYFAEVEKYDWVKTGEWCTKVPEPYRPGCYHAIGQTQVGFTQDYALMARNCALLQGKDAVAMCIRGAAGGIFERYNDGLDRMLQLCAVSGDAYADACYSTFTDTLRMANVSDAERNARCARVPEPFRKGCAATPAN